MPKLYLQSLGCNKNLVDSEIMLGRLQNYTLCDEARNADVLIVNTCGFIESAKKESIETILNLHQKRKKNSLLVVTGCLMQRYREELMRELPEVDLFTGVGDFDKIDSLILKKQNLFSNSTYLQNSETKRIITGSNFHAFIKISEGCNQNCAFCAIPSFKGRLQSRSLKDIVCELENLVKMGYKDFSFIAQDSSSYLLDKGEKNGLLKLIEAVEGIKGIAAARILYLYPSTLSKIVVDKIISSKVFVNYFDMPLQHINDNMLKLMKRGTKREQILKLLKQMRNAPQSFLRTGFIVGHPGESEEDFLELCAFVREFDFDRISIFGYSKEEDTLAFKMEQISSKVINARLKKMEKITEELLEKNFAKEVGQIRKVLCVGESSEGEFFVGGKDLRWDRDIDGEILINESLCGKLKMGEIYECEIIQSVDKKLIAKALKKSDVRR